MPLEDRRAPAGAAERPSPFIFPGKRPDASLVEPHYDAAKVLKASGVTPRAWSACATPYKRFVIPDPTRAASKQVK